MLALRKVAVTGGLSCGKSTVCHFFSELGSKVVYADEIVHQLLKPETLLGQKVIELLGPNILTKGQIDRSKIASKVFANPKQLHSLEKLLHPIVYEEIEKEYNSAVQDKDITLFIAEIPLLFESGGNKFFDTIITITAPLEQCWERFLNSTGYEREEFDRRMANQMDPLEKAKRANYIIRNNGSLDQLKQEVNKLYETLNTPI